ncbi:MAG: long-chain fatty acid--CoA ligase [Ruminococcaceae bacterium]|nr:long-chain fatty acid--CoA ligase [Oscillospiraceae bacterium]
MRTYNNLKPVDPPKPIVNFKEMLRENAELFGEKAIYIYKDNGEMQEKSYIQFHEDIINFSTMLYESGLAGKRIAVTGDTHPAWMTAFFATIITGGVIVPLDRELDADQMADFMKVAECSAVVYTAALTEKVEGAAAKLPFIEKFIPVGKSTFEDNRLLPFDTMLEEGARLIKNGDTRYSEQDTDLERMVAILFTSGTTGTSKGVMLSYKNFIACSNACCQSTQYSKDDVFVSVLPIHHTYELSTVQLSGPNLGATIVICEGVRYATRYFKEYKPTALVLVPLFLETIHKKIWSEIKRKGLEKKVKTAIKVSNSLLKTGVDIREKMFSDVTSVFGGNLKSIVAGGAPLDPQIVRDFYSFGITVLQGYGITECSPLVSVNRPGKVSFTSVGQAVEGVEVKIEQIPDSTGEEGEILVRGENVMMGYYDNKEATDAVITEDGWFRTGDIGTIDKKGYIYITGRLKNVIIASNGKNIYPEELEEHLYRLSTVKECVVIGRDTEDGVCITAVIVPDYEIVGEGTTDTALSCILKEEIAQINRSLPSYKHINRFEIRHEDFEKTLTKKIKRFLVK